MPTAVEFNPYAISEALELRLSDPFDPHDEMRWEARAPQDGDTDLVFDLSGADGWRELTMQLEATLPISELGRILPATTDPVSDTVLIVTVRCPTTLSRHAVRMEPEEPGRWSGELHLHHSAVRGVVTLQPRLVRRTELPTSADAPGGVARGRHAVVAEGRGVKLLVDRTEPPISGALDIRWEDFRSSINEWRRSHVSDIHYLDTSGIEPIVWLNLRYVSLRAALHSADSSGPEAMLRHMGNALIAQSVWLQLFMVAAHSVDLDQEMGTMRSPSGWRAAVLQSILPKLFPEHTEQEDRLAELHSQLRSPEQVGALVTRLGSAIQESLPTHRRIEDAIAAGERRSTPEE